VVETSNPFQSVSLPALPGTPALTLVFSVFCASNEAEHGIFALLSEALSAMWQSPQHQATLAAEAWSPLEKS
jgi:hypothetical protein